MVGIDDDVHFGTTPVEVTFDDEHVELSSGFFFSTIEGGPRPFHEPPSWRAVSSTSLVLCRHALVSESGARPTRLTFFLRSFANDSVTWFPWTIEAPELERNSRTHQTSAVDVAILRLDDHLQMIAEKQLGFRAFADTLLPSEHNPLVPHLGSGVLVAGYPSGLADETNCFPIVKSGVITSRWGLSWEGRPAFLIDAQLFPGSSGSVVVSQPTQLVIHEDRILRSKEPQFVLLGVYTGSPEWSSGGHDSAAVESMGIGVVAYASVIAEIVESGRAFLLGGVGLDSNGR